MSEALDAALRSELGRRGEGSLVGFVLDSGVPAKGRGWVRLDACFARDPREAAALREGWDDLWPPRAHVFPPDGLVMAALLDRDGYDADASGEAALWVVEQARTRRLPEPRITGGADA